MSTANGFPLRSFEVEGYRAIRHLLLPDLARVNLFVGRNNAGKTSLLEAVRLYASAGSMSVLSEIIRAHSGIGRSGVLGVRRTPGDVERSFDAARSLFNAAHPEPCETITLGPADAPADRLRISLEAAGSAAGSEPTVRLEEGEHSRQIPLSTVLSGTTVRAWSAGMPAESVPAQGVESERLGELWSRAVESGRVPLVEMLCASSSPILSAST
jgi:hypothetical protein